MIAKFFPLSIALVSAVAGSAAAHDADGCESGDRTPATYQAPAPVYATPAGYRAGPRAEYPAPPDARQVDARNELRHSDLNRDGRVTLAEALQQGRRDFRYSDRDQNRALTPREVSWGDVAREDRDRNGWISYGEYQDAIRRSFSRLDTNRDGVLASYELRQQPMGQRPAGWRR